VIVSMIVSSLNIRFATTSYTSLEVGALQGRSPNAGEVDVPSRRQFHHLLGGKGNPGRR
jgi:hypothetical protein